MSPRPAGVQFDYAPTGTGNAMEGKNTKGRWVMWGGHSCPPLLTFAPRSKAQPGEEKMQEQGQVNRKVKGGGQECPPHMFRLLLLLGNDYVLDLVVCCLRDDFFLHQFVLGAVGAAVDDLLRIGVADTGQGFELIFRR